MSLGHRLKELRARSEKTQEEIVKLLRANGIMTNRVTLSRWENDEQEPTLNPVMTLASIYNVTVDYIISGNDDILLKKESKLKALRIPVLGHIPAGTPVDAVEDILDWEELDPRQFNPNNDYFGLMVRGDSMYPEYFDGDIIIVQQDPTPESGKDVVAYVNGYEATLKRLYKYENGSIELRAVNPNYESKKFTQSEMEETPVVIMGYVKELRRIN